VWIQRTIGVANAARIERAARAITERVRFTDVLSAVEKARSNVPSDEGPRADETSGAPRERAPAVPTYWSVVFDVVTPAAWARLLDAAMSQALSGDPRAREWIASVLGADGAIDEVGRADAEARYVTISTLTRTLERERAGMARSRCEY